MEIDELNLKPPTPKQKPTVITDNEVRFPAPVFPNHAEVNEFLDGRFTVNVGEEPLAYSKEKIEQYKIEKQGVFEDLIQRGMICEREGDSTLVTYGHVVWNTTHTSINGFGQMPGKANLRTFASLDKQQREIALEVMLELSQMLGYKTPVFFYGWLLSHKQHAEHVLGENVPQLLTAARAIGNPSHSGAFFRDLGKRDTRWTDHFVPWPIYDKDNKQFVIAGPVLPAYLADLTERQLALVTTVLNMGLYPFMRLTRASENHVTLGVPIPMKR